MDTEYPQEFLARLHAVTGKRPKTVIDHILKFGQITTEDLRDLYGYSHPPRAIKDVTELGIPIERTSVKAKDGRTIAAYCFGDPAAIRSAVHGGRTNLPKRFKQQLIDRDGTKCALCRIEFASAFLQIDHCIPYEVGGQAPGDPRLGDYMLVCRTCNRGKSWSCEHCPNWTTDKSPEMCQTCFWCRPDNYTHIATIKIRRLHLVWREAEVGEYETLAAMAHKADAELPDFVKDILRKHVDPGSTGS